MWSKRKTVNWPDRRTFYCIYTPSTQGSFVHCLKTNYTSAFVSSYCTYLTIVLAYVAFRHLLIKKFFTTNYMTIVGLSFSNRHSVFQDYANLGQFTKIVSEWTSVPFVRRVYSPIRLLTPLQMMSFTDIVLNLLDPYGHTSCFLPQPLKKDSLGNFVLSRE